MLVIDYEKRRTTMFLFKRNAKIIGLTMACGIALTTLANADYSNRDSHYDSNYYSDRDSRNYGENYNRGERHESGNPDQDLAKKIRDKIGSGWFRKGYDDVQVQVRNGNVLLQGTVKTWEDKEKVEKEVNKIHGVKSVNSQISVQNQRPNNPKNQRP